VEVPILRLTSKACAASPFFAATASAGLHKHLRGVGMASKVRKASATSRFLGLKGKAEY
jgi:hypothetical protein